MIWVIDASVAAKWLTFDARAHRAIASFGVSLNLMDELPEGW